MEKDSFSFKVAGAAGEGIMSTGLLFSKVCARHGFFIFDYSEYPSLITGGHNTYQVHLSKNPVYVQNPKTDVLLALNQETLALHKDELSQDSIVIYDGQSLKTPIAEFGLSAKTIDVPLKRLAQEAGGKELMANNVGLGAAAYLMGLDLAILNSTIADVFVGKSTQIIETDQKAATAGYNFAKSKMQVKPISLNTQNSNNLTMTGNEALALGALAGGLQFYASYPMTPTSSILHFLAEKAAAAQIVVKQAEDEISVISMALGASFAGVRSMVATSGGGFCLMVETLGLAGFVELPIVIIEGQRPGPALGLPTWTDQGDLKFVLAASHGEFPRFVISPSDAKEAFDLSRKAQVLSEVYQTPVIILADKYLCESRFSFNLETETYTNSRFGLEKTPVSDKTGFFPRYKITDTPVSLRTIPGTPGGTYIANADEHDQYGLTSEESEDRTGQIDKRNKKLDPMSLEIPNQYFEEEPNATATFISFGSTKGPIKAARQMLTKEGIPTAHLNLSWLWPFPADQVKAVLDKSKNVIVVEGNSEGQLANLVAQETGFIAKYKLNRYDGRPFYAQDITDYLKKAGL